MAWNGTIAHKVTIGYLILKYKLNAVDLVHAKIQDLPFYNQDASPAIRDQEIKLFAGEFVTYLESMQFPPQGDRNETTAYNDLVEAGGKGDQHCSILGDAVDANYKFIDEE